MDAIACYYFDKIIEILLKQEKVKTSARGIQKQTYWTGGMTVAGGIFFGPIGCLAGSMLGSGIGYALSDDYPPMIKELKTLTAEEETEIIEAVKQLVGYNTIAELVKFARNSEGQNQLKNRVSEVLNQQRVRRD